MKPVNSIQMLTSLRLYTGEHETSAQKGPDDQEVQTKNYSYCEYITMPLVTRNKI